MATSLVHIGDFHAHAGPRGPQRYQALDQIIAAGLALPHLGAWLWPGDLNHTGHVGRPLVVEDTNAIAERLLRMANAAPVVIVYGNHDFAGDLDVFAKLEAAHPIYVIDRPTCVRVRLATWEDATVFCLPYPTKAGLASMGVTPADVVDVAADALEPIFMHAAAELAAARANGDLTLMIGHVNVGGSIVSSGQPNIGREIELAPRHLDRLGLIYKGLNHIHRGQAIAGAWYAGSVCRLDWGEIEEKRWLQIVLDKTVMGEDVFDVVSHPIDVPPMFHIEGRLTRDGFFTAHDELMCPACSGDGDGVKDPSEGTLACATCQGSGRRSFAGCEVRVRCTFKQSEKSVLDFDLVRARFAGALTLKVEEFAEPDSPLRAPHVAAARTLRDKLHAWWDYDAKTREEAAKQFVTVETLMTALDRLEHTDPLQLLAEIQTELAAIEAEKETVAA